MSARVEGSRPDVVMRENPGVEAVLAGVSAQWHAVSEELERERVLQQLAGMLDAEPSWADLRTLSLLQGVELDDTGKLMRLMATRRVVAFLEGQSVRDVVDLAGESERADTKAERTRRHEVALALGRTKDQAQFVIALYRRLVTEFPSFVDALTAGEVGFRHCSVLHEETLLVEDPEALGRIADKALAFAQVQSPSRFRASVRRLVVRHDPDATARRRQARRQRRVSFSRLGDGISSMTVVARTEDVDAVRDLVDQAAAQLLAADKAAAREGGAGERLTAGQARSDAVIAALLGQVDADGTVTYAPREHRVVHLELVMDAATAAGIRDDLARLGSEPIAAGLARALMLDASTVARVLVADRTRHLLEKSPRTYLTNRHRSHVQARDRALCRCCGRRATRGEMDHLVPFLRGGPSTPGNEWWLCRECHQRKTAGQLVVSGDADGVVVITTPAGLVFTSSPPPYLDDPDHDSLLAARTPRVGFALPRRRTHPTIPAWLVAPPPPPTTTPEPEADAAATDDDPPPF